MKIRTATKDDLPFIASLLDVVFLEFGVPGKALDRENVAQIPNYYTERGGSFWVIEDQDEIVGSIGVIMVSFRGAKAGFIQRLAVKPEHRQKQIGSSLYEKVESFADKSGWEFLLLGVDNQSYVGALSFYKKRGYEKIALSEVPQALLDDNDEFYFYKKLTENF